MTDPNAMVQGLENQNTMKVVQKLADSEEVARLAKTIDQSALRNAATKQDPEVMRAILSQLLATEEGRRLAKKVKAAMENG